MSFCFQSFNCLSKIKCCISKDRSLSKGKKNHTLVNLSTIRKEEESHNPAGSNNRITFSNKPSNVRNFSGPINGRANCIGIIGGLSVDSTLNFVKKLKSEDKESELPFIVCSDPPLGNVLLPLERSSLDVDHGLIVENLRRKRVFLEKSGVCCIVMPCNISHSWYDEIKEGCLVPFLDMGECVAMELKKAKLRPLEGGSRSRIGVLATNATLVGGFYKEKLENEGFEVILPDKATMEHIVIPAVDAIKRKDYKGAQNLFKIALRVLLVRAVNRVILASDELRPLLPPDDPLWTKCVDPIHVLARSSIKYARSIGRGKKL